MLTTCRIDQLEPHTIIACGKRMACILALKRMIGTNHTRVHWTPIGEPVQHMTYMRDDAHVKVIK